MKKIIILTILLLTVITNSFAENQKFQYLSGNETDIIITEGEYKNMHRILNHSLSGEYEIYFEATDTSSHISTKNISKHDMNEYITFTSNNIPKTTTRANWYQILKIFDPNNEKKFELTRIVGDKFYKEFFAYEYGHSYSEKLANEYIEKIFRPREYPNAVKPIDRFSMANVKIESTKKKR